MSDIRPEYEALWPRKKRWLRPLRRWLQYWLARGAVALADRLPFPMLLMRPFPLHAGLRVSGTRPASF